MTLECHHLFHRYGPLFKTSFLGKPVVVSMDMEVNRFILQHHDKLFKSWYPDTMENIFGDKNLKNLGSIHKYVRSIRVPFFAPKNLKEAFIFEMGENIKESLKAWATNPSIELKQSLRNVSFVSTYNSFMKEICMPSFFRLLCYYNCT